ncbi:ABC transporter permease [Salsipaludibacter albus]|uniref:ABC transporter permease n=1 Tax=Salsipaludibacter albus TaxID=2849650 RepID=UPI001EE4B0DE|nr:ABC transporter permease [Salsipaludibacter albus]MBY5160952.1 ABC transporter permease [Salsipaludibacter albus]
MTLATIAWRTVRANPARFLGTLLAVVVATTFLSSALVLRDSLANALTSNAVAALGDVDVAVEPAVDPDDPSAEFGLEASSGLDLGIVDEIAAVDGISSAIGESSSSVELSVPDVDDPIGGTAWVVVDDPLTPWDLESGRLPTAAGEIALDVDTAAAVGIDVGDATTVTSRTGPAEVTVVGLSTFGQQSARGEADVLVSRADGQRFTGLEDRGWSTVLGGIEEGADPAVVRSAVADVAGPEAQVLSGDDLRDREAGAAAGIADALGIGLQAFAYLALVVGALIIFNTFTTIVAQRTREFALLRALGTSSRQVRRAVRVEALVVSLVASLAGALLGVVLVGLAILLIPALAGLATLTVRPLAMLQVVLSGVVVTVVSAFIPAWRASRTRPVEAMRDADPTIKPISLGRSITGVALLALGVVALVAGSIGSIALLLGGGATLLLVGVIVGGPTVVSWVARRLRGPLGRLSAADEIAVAEVDRNARRTAATANALVIGVFLVVFVTAAGGAIRDFAIGQLEQLSGADVSVSSGSEQGLPPEFLADLRAVDGVDEVAEVNTIVGSLELEMGGPQFGGGGLPVAAADVSQLTDVLGLEVTQGEVDPDGMVLAGEIATAAGVGIGDEVAVVLVDGTPLDVEVTALSGFSFEIPPAVLSRTVVEDTIGPQPVLSASVRYDDGANIETARTGVEAVADDYAGVDVIDANQIVSVVRTFFNFLLSAVGALLGVAVVIALFGILNTLVLAIAERTRELGLMRSVGMTRSQLRRMIRTEALLTSIVGTVTGAVLGVGVAFAVARVVLEGAFTWPWWQLGVTLVLGVVVGVLASVYPARRAARLDPLEAIRTG